MSTKHKSEKLRRNPLGSDAPTKRTHKPLQCLRFRDLVRLGIVNNRMTLRRWVQTGHFPAPIRLGPNLLAWRAAEVEQFLEKRQRVTYAGGPQEAA